MEISRRRERKDNFVSERKWRTERLKSEMDRNLVCLNKFLFSNTSSSLFCRSALAAQIVIHLRRSALEKETWKSGERFIIIWHRKTQSFHSKLIWNQYFVSLAVLKLLSFSATKGNCIVVKTSGLGIMKIYSLKFFSSSFFSAFELKIYRNIWLTIKGRCFAAVIISNTYSETWFRGFFVSYHNIADNEDVLTMTDIWLLEICLSYISSFPRGKNAIYSVAINHVEIQFCDANCRRCGDDNRCFQNI